MFSGPFILCFCEPEELILSEQIGGADAISLVAQAAETADLLQTRHHNVITVAIRHLFMQFGYRPRLVTSQFDWSGS